MKNKLTSLWSVKLDYKFVESTQDRDFMFTLDAKKKTVKANIYYWRGQRLMKFNQGQIRLNDDHTEMT